MGSGEPLDYSNTLKFMHNVHNPKDIIWMEKRTLSTCGLVSRCACWLMKELALPSRILHAPNNNILENIMKIANVYTIEGSECK